MNADIRDIYDVAVFGAGPAGLAAATLTARAGISTILFDEQASPGGQIYRSITETPVARHKVFDRDRNGKRLADAFAASGAQYVPGATVWGLSSEREIGVSYGDGSRLLTARRVIVATGALERPFPIPGWTLPGVMTAGAAQILLKSSGLVPARDIVLAGSGPLIWLLAWQYLQAGVHIEALLDTTPAANRARAWPHVVPFLFSPYMTKGLVLLSSVRRHVRVIDGVTGLRAIGRDRVEQVAYRRNGAAETVLTAGTLLLHQGVVPNVNLAMAAGIEHRWDDLQLCWYPVLDDFGNSSVDGIAIAGDGAGIAGAQAAEQRGALAGIAAVRALAPGAGTPNEAHVRRALKNSLRGRTFLDLMYRPEKMFRVPRGDTIVCRCEEVTAQQILDAVTLGCPGPNQLKTFLRCGMGPCQGRLCGLTVTELIADARGAPPQEIGYYRLRPPVKPITVAELASLPTSAAAVKAVVRT